MPSATESPTLSGPPAYVVIGNLLVDDLVFCSGQTRMGEPGGAVLYAALGASLWSQQVACTSVVGSDYPPLALQALRARGVDLQGVRALGRPGVRTWLIYEDAVRRMLPRLHGPSHADMSPAPANLPAAYAQARAFHLAPMPLACQRVLAEQLQRQPQSLITLDPHLPITESTLADWRPVLALVDAVFPAEEELQLEGLQHDLRAALRRLAGGRLRYVLLKQGERGGVLYDLATDSLQPWSARAPAVIDATGAGDAFAAGFATALVDGQPVSAALLRAAVTASFALAGWGPVGLLAATPAAAQARLAEWTGS